MQLCVFTIPNHKFFWDFYLGCKFKPIKLSYQWNCINREAAVHSLCLLLLWLHSRLRWIVVIISEHKAIKTCVILVGGQEPRNTKWCGIRVIMVAKFTWANFLFQGHQDNIARYILRISLHNQIINTPDF